MEIFNTLNNLTSRDEDNNIKKYVIKKCIWIDKPTILCEGCKRKFKTDEDYPTCNICDYFHDANEVKTNLEEVIHKEDVAKFIHVAKTDKTYGSLDIAEIHTINVKIGSRTFYCIFVACAMFEPNSWSSSPHDDFWKYWFVFFDKQKRDEWATNRENEIFGMIFDNKN
jgi:hypothetical protein